MNYFLLLDDHEIVRNGVKNVIQELFKPCTVYDTGDEDVFIRYLKKKEIDLVIMDVQMPNVDTPGLMEYIKNNYPGIKVLIFSMSAENIYAKRFLKAGAMGFVSKSADVSELKKAIGLALNSRRYISDNLSNLLADQISAKETTDPFQKLSAREFDIAAALMRGDSISEIGAASNISVSTVGTYKARVFKKLAVNNISQLIETGRLYNKL